MDTESGISKKSDVLKKKRRGEYCSFLPIYSPYYVKDRYQVNTDDIALVTDEGKVEVNDYDHRLYVSRIDYGLEDDDFLIKSDPERKYEIRIYERSDEDYGKMRYRARIRRETGKIVLAGSELLTKTEDIYTYREQYGLKDDDFEFVDTY